MENRNTFSDSGRGKRQGYKVKQARRPATAAADQKGRQGMQAYYIIYTVGKDEKQREASIDAKDLKSAKRKIGHKHGYKSGNMIKLKRVSVIGYY